MSTIYHLPSTIYRLKIKKALSGLTVDVCTMRTSIVATAKGCILPPRGAPGATLLHCAKGYLYRSWGLKRARLIDVASRNHHGRGYPIPRRVPREYSGLVLIAMGFRGAAIAAKYHLARG
jgi:hypothetical protein